MKLIKIVLFIICPGMLCCENVFAQNDKYKEFVFLQNGDLLLEDFQNEEVGNLPEYWFNRDAKRKPKYYKEKDKKKYMYSIQTEGENKFLRYDGWDGKHMNLPLKVSKKISLKEHPVLSWKWRAFKLPENGNEDKKKKNDVALSVYVVFKVVGFFKLPKSIRYTWSTTLPKGKVLSKFGNRQKIVVLESGEENLGEWLTVERNLVEDYKTYFGGEPPARPLGLLILSDADNTKDSAKGDYDDFILKRVMQVSRE